MSTRTLGLLLAQNRELLLKVAETGGWQLLPKTAFSFEKFVSDDDLLIPFVDDMDGIAVDVPGCIALAFRDE